MVVTEYKQPQSVLVLIYTPEREVLLLERVKPAGFWQSVTGSLEPGELPLQAAHREVQEETGLSDVPIQSCCWQNRFQISEQWRHRYAPGVTHNTEHVFRCELAKKPDRIQLAADEHSNYRWCALTDAIDQVGSYTNRDAFYRFISTG